MNLPKQKRKAYEDKIQELHKELEEEARELGKVKGSLDHARRELSQAKDEKEKVEFQIEEARKKIHPEDKRLTELQASYKKLAEDHNLSISKYTEKIKELEKEALAIETRISGLKRLEMEHEALISKIKGVKNDLENQYKLIGEARVLLVKIEAEINNSDLPRQKMEIQSLIEKNGKILTDTEKNLNIIRVYARRLQRMYNKNGIKFDVLSKFNVEDNQTFNETVT